MSETPELYTTLRRFRLWKLDIRVKEYGVDYYWNGTWVMTSAPRDIMVIHRGFVHIWYWSKWYQVRYKAIPR